MLNRLLGIIYILMNRGTVTAGDLAKRFEVSVRTIYRDVESLSMAGIPVYATKGKNGGISLTEQFVLDKMLVTKEEQTQILAALVSLQETGAQDEKETLEKLGEFFNVEPQNWVAIDLSDWSGSRQQLFEQIKNAILKHKILTFDYYNQASIKSFRTVEPIQLLFKDYTWYVKAYCRNKEAMRLFKVLRMKNVNTTEEVFVPNKSKLEELEINTDLSKNDEINEYIMKVTLLIDKKEAYRVYDRFEEDEITIQENGDFLVQTGCSWDDWNFGMILAFGPSCQVIEPEKFRKEIQIRVEQMRNLYK